jgi:hypothetical protein
MLFVRKFIIFIRLTFEIIGDLTWYQNKCQISGVSDDLTFSNCCCVITGIEYLETLHPKEQQKILPTQLPASSQRMEL